MKHLMCALLILCFHTQWSSVWEGQSQNSLQITKPADAHIPYTKHLQLFSSRLQSSQIPFHPSLIQCKHYENSYNLYCSEIMAVKV